MSEAEDLLEGPEEVSLAERQHRGSWRVDDDVRVGDGGALGGGEGR